MKSFCGGSRGAVFTKSIPLAAGGKSALNIGIEKKLQNPLSYGKVVKQLKEYGFCLIGERIE
jgi:hypothetical protein